MCGQNADSGCIPKAVDRLSESNQMQVPRLLPLSRLPPAQKESLTVPNPEQPLPRHTPAPYSCYRGSSDDFSVGRSLSPLASDTRMCSMLGLYTMPVGLPGLTLSPLSPKVKNWCMLMNTMLTPIRKFMVSLCPNSAQLRMAVKIVAMVLLYFFRMVSANCRVSTVGQA